MAARLPAGLTRSYPLRAVCAFATRKRMELARRLLQDVTLSIADVAQACGYQHQSSFAEAFRRETGKTPRQWRSAAGV